MSPIWRYRLDFPDGFHVSSGGFAEEHVDPIIASDTLTGAVLSAYALLFGDAALQALIHAASLPFRLSSAFPVVSFGGNEQSVWLLPVPLQLWQQWIAGFEASSERTDFNGTPEGGSNGKQWKYVQFVSETVLQMVLNVPAEERTAALKQQTAILGSWWITDEEAKRLKEILRWKSEEGEPVVGRAIDRPRVSIDRVSSGSNVFYFAEFHWDPAVGLYFFATFDGETDQRQFEAALDLLADEGIGADRTVGKGWFRWEKSLVDSTLPIQPSRPARVWCNLGLYMPTAEELNHFLPEQSYYQIVTRRGWIGAWEYADQRRRPLRAFREGSTLTFREPVQLRGQLASAHDPQQRTIVRNFQTLFLALPQE